MIWCYNVLNSATAGMRGFGPAGPGGGESVVARHVDGDIFEPTSRVSNNGYKGLIICHVYKSMGFFFHLHASFSLPSPISSSFPVSVRQTLCGGQAGVGGRCVLDYRCTTHVGVRGFAWSTMLKSDDGHYPVHACVPYCLVDSFDMAADMGESHKARYLAY